MDIYERYGRKTEQLEQEIESHLNTIGVLRAVKSGELPLDRLTVTPNGWHIDPLETPEDEPVKDDKKETEEPEKPEE